MEKKDRVIKHLEIIQGIVNRLAHDSFLVKGWSITLIVAGVIFISKNNELGEWFILSFLIVIVGLWILDGYFLWQERLFREVYNDIRKQDDTDFAMDVAKHMKKPKCNWPSSIFSITLNIFYGIEVLFILSIVVVLKYGQFENNLCNFKPDACCNSQVCKHRSD